MAKGQVRAIDPSTVAYCLMGIGEFMGLRWILWERRAIKEEDINALMDFIYYGIAPAMTKELARP